MRGRTAGPKARSMRRGWLIGPSGEVGVAADSGQIGKERYVRRARGGRLRISPRQRDAGTAQGHRRQAELALRERAHWGGVVTAGAAHGSASRSTQKEHEPDDDTEHHEDRHRRLRRLALFGGRRHKGAGPSDGLRLILLPAIRRRQQEIDDRGQQQEDEPDPDLERMRRRARAPSRAGP